ncbi:hypothetical protein BC826DRAFT_975928 [Russula brevipes]|nr:hypothetical protein BC826DRAFT_975928 [Russula brevipes]
MTAALHSLHRLRPLCRLRPLVAFALFVASALAGRLVSHTGDEVLFGGSKHEVRGVGLRVGTAGSPIEAGGSAREGPAVEWPLVRPPQDQKMDTVRRVASADVLGTMQDLIIAEEPEALQTLAEERDDIDDEGDSDASCTARRFHDGELPRTHALLVAFLPGSFPSHPARPTHSEMKGGVNQGSGFDVVVAAAAAAAEGMRRCLKWSMKDQVANVHRQRGRRRGVRAVGWPRDPTQVEMRGKRKPRGASRGSTWTIVRMTQDQGLVAESGWGLATRPTQAGWAGSESWYEEPALDVSGLASSVTPNASSGLPSTASTN